ncbi:MAG: FAD-dependent oxidoreductase, partial [Chthoniobacterales bacterium]
MPYDVAVAGLGGMGSAILAHCARRGASVLGLEQFTPAHGLGSSGGKSRMIRKAYFEDPAYVPLVLHAYELWRDLERETGADLLRISGALFVGSEESKIIAGSRR